jgi:hypothetical protein
MIGKAFEDLLLLDRALARRGRFEITGDRLVADLG